MYSSILEIIEENDKVVLDTSGLISLTRDINFNNPYSLRNLSWLSKGKVMMTREVIREFTTKERRLNLKPFDENNGHLGGIYRRMIEYLTNYEEGSFLDRDKAEKTADISVIALTLAIANERRRIACVSGDYRICQTIKDIVAEHDYIEDNGLEHPEGFPCVLIGEVSVYCPQTVLREFTSRTRITNGQCTSVQ